MPHLHLGILHPQRLFRRMVAKETSTPPSDCDLRHESSRMRQTDTLDATAHPAMPRVRPAAKKVAFAAVPSLIPPSNFRISAESLTPLGYNHPLHFVKTTLRLAASGHDVSETTLDVLDALISQDATDKELLSLRIIANRCAQNSALCIQDCEKILEDDPNHRFALLHRAAAWLDINALHRYSNKNRTQAEMAAQAWIAEHPTDLFGIFLRAAATGSHKTRQNTEALLSASFNNDPKYLLRGQLLYAYQCSMYSYRPSQELFDRIQASARALKNIDSGNSTTLRLLGCISEADFDGPLSISTRQFLKWPILQQDPEIDHLFAIKSPAE